MFRDEFVLKKRVSDEPSAHSKAVLDDSLITADTTAHHLIKGLAKKSHESHNSRIALSTVIFSSVVISLPVTQSLHSRHILCLACKYLSFFAISELAAMKQPNNSLHLPQLTRDTRKIANKVMIVASGQINS